MITWKASIDGNDIVIGSYMQPVTASWFGGPRDVYDDGNTASGTPNKLMGAQGCSLPMYEDANGKIVAACAGSPLGPIPWQTPIVVNSLVRGASGVPAVGMQKTLPLIDVGPDTALNRPLDLCPQSFVDLGGNLDVGLIHVFLRIVGAARFLRA